MHSVVTRPSPGHTDADDLLATRSRLLMNRTSFALEDPSSFSFVRRFCSVPVTTRPPRTDGGSTVGLCLCPPKTQPPCRLHHTCDRRVSLRTNGWPSLHSHVFGHMRGLTPPTWKTCNVILMVRGSGVYGQRVRKPDLGRDVFICQSCSLPVPRALVYRGGSARQDKRGLGLYIMVQGDGEPHCS